MKKLVTGTGPLYGLVAVLSIVVAQFPLGKKFFAEFTPHFLPILTLFSQRKKKIKFNKISSLNVM